MWNEVWILRPDYPDLDCDGWHVIDATPQEQSYGEFTHFGEWGGHVIDATPQEQSYGEFSHFGEWVGGGRGARH